MEKISYYTNGVPYIPFSVMMEKFHKEYPNGKIDVQVSTDPEHQSNTWIAQATIWKDAEKATADNYTVRCSARRASSDEADPDAVEISPYDLVTTAAIRKALTLMGYTIPVEEAEKLQEEYIKEHSDVTPAPVEVSTPAAPVPQPVETPAPAPVEQAKEEGKKPTEPAKTETAEPPKPKKTKAETKPASQPEPKPKTKPEIIAGLESEAGMTYADAKALPSNYRDKAEVTLGVLKVEDPSIYNWMSRSATFKKKNPAVAAAIALIEAVDALE